MSTDHDLDHRLGTELERRFHSDEIPTFDIDPAQITSTVRRQRRHTWVGSVAGVAAASLVAAGGMWWASSGTDRTAPPAASTTTVEVDAPTLTAPRTAPTPPSPGQAGDTVATTQVRSGSNPDEHAKSTVTLSSTTDGEIDRVTLSSKRKGAPPEQTWQLDLDTVKRYGVALRWTKDEAFVIVPKGAEPKVVSRPAADLPIVYEVSGADLEVWAFGPADGPAGGEDALLSSTLATTPLPHLMWTASDGSLHANAPGLAAPVRLTDGDYWIDVQVDPTYGSVRSRDSRGSTSSSDDTEVPGLPVHVTGGEASYEDETTAKATREVIIGPKGATALTVTVGSGPPIQPVEVKPVPGTTQVAALFVYSATINDGVEVSWRTKDGARVDESDIRGPGMEPPRKS